jgi:hypothetical protein
MHMWKSYLEKVREEVHLGVGIFSEDEHLRCLMRECFEVGDAINGVVHWDQTPSDLKSSEHSSALNPAHEFLRRHIAVNEGS